MIYKIADINKINESEKQGFFTDESLRTEGFIHLSKRDQVVDVANKHYAGKKNQYLIEVDQDKLTSELRYEDLKKTGNFFPHVYGTINWDSVVRIIKFESDGNSYYLPEELKFEYKSLDSSRTKAVRELVNKNIKKIDVCEKPELTDIKYGEIIHYSGVAVLAKLLAIKRGEDHELAYIAGCIHDIGRIKENLHGIEHAQRGSELAEKIMKKMEIFTDEEIEKVCHAIKNHSYKQNIDSSFDELLKDADLIDNYLRLPEEIAVDDFRIERLNRIMNEIIKN